MQPLPVERLRGVVLKAVAFPVVLGVLIFVGTMIENPDHSLRTIVTVFIFACMWVALSTVPFVFFGWIRWQGTKSRSEQDESNERVKGIPKSAAVSCNNRLKPTFPISAMGRTLPLDSRPNADFTAVGPGR